MLDSNLMQRANSLENTLMLGKTEGRRRRRQRMRQLDGIIDSMDLNLSKLLEMVRTVHGVAKSQTWFSNYTTTMSLKFTCVIAYFRISFLFEAEQYSFVGTDNISLTHSSADGHLIASIFCLLWIVLLWICLYKYLFKTLLLIHLGIYPEVELLDQWQFYF